MKALIQILGNIGDLLIGIFDFIISFFQDLVFIISISGKFVLNIPDYFAWLPSGLLSILIIIFSVVVIYKVIGREG